jgi:citrate synthase
MSTIHPLQTYIENLSDEIVTHYDIEEHYFQNPNIKRGLRNSDGTGVVAGVTRVASVQGYYIEDGERVPMDGHLYYRGIDVSEIVEAHRADGTFGYEEVVYLLLLGSLPNAEQLDCFRNVLSKARVLPEGFVEDVIIKMPSQSIMNALSRSILALYAYDPNPDDLSLKNLLLQSLQIIARFPLIAANAYAVKRHYHDGKSLYLHYPKEGLSLSENFLRMLRRDKSFSIQEARLLDLMLILHAEHGGGNNSAFVCRTLSSTGTDTYSAIAGAVSSLKGSLHGGANKKVMEMFRDIKSSVGTASEDKLSRYLDKILDKEANDRTGIIYGLGHAVYTASDPRAEIIKKYAVEMAAGTDKMEDFELMQRIEKLGIEKLTARKNLQIPICANVDMYSGLVYEMLGIPEDLFTPLFAIARIAGWCAHRIEEVISGKKLIRPAYRAAIRHSAYTPMSERE